MVQEGLLSCKIATGLKELRYQTQQSRWLVVSGGDQKELHSIFAQRNLNSFFDGGIFGSPDTKDHILARELNSGNIQFPALFLGDSKYDYQAANQAGIDFVFISGWSEITGYQQWCKDNNLTESKELKSLLMHLQVNCFY